MKIKRFIQWKIKQTIESNTQWKSNKMEIKRPTGNQTQISFRNANCFGNRFGNTIKQPMEIKQIRNQTPNRKSIPNRFMKRKLFRKSFRKYNQTTNKKSIPNRFMKSKLFRKSFQKYNQKTNKKSNPNRFMKRKLFRKSFRKYNQTANKKSIPNRFMKHKLFQKTFRK